MYEYVATVVKVTDGDTIVVNIDLGFSITFQEIVRLYGINAYEIKLGKNTTADQKQKGLEGKTFLKNTIEGKKVILKTYKDSKEKYGRYLATILLQNDNSLEVTNINDLMIQNGFAIAATY
jgi:endonuclease YncB( thermonuclease family)